MKQTLTALISSPTVSHCCTRSASIAESLDKHGDVGPTFPFVASLLFLRADEEDEEVGRAFHAAPPSRTSSAVFTFLLHS
jgi:hypothetical protein